MNVKRKVIFVSSMTQECISREECVRFPFNAFVTAKACVKVTPVVTFSNGSLKRRSYAQEG